MKRLKHEVFITIFIILTLALFFILAIFFVQNYTEEKNNIIKNLENTGEMTINNKEPKPGFNKPNDINKQDNNAIFMDSTIYTVLLNANNNIVDIINHSRNNLDTSSITDIANSILNSKNVKDIYVGFLLTEKYSYSYLENNYLVILDNSDITNKLVSSFITSIIIFICLEVVIIFTSRIIANKITKPVQTSFNKQRQFVMDASHELKTPLAVIMASSEALELYPNEEKWLRNIKSEASRMNNLITDLLELARTEKEVQKEYVEDNLSKTVELVVLTFEGIIFEHKIDFEYHIKDNINMKMDSDSIKQLVEILLDNAIKHSDVNGNICLNLDIINNDIVLEVKNKGEAIPEEDEVKIFERFYRVDKSRNRNENRYGLGLAIAKNIVENHNGKISAHSKDGYTTFKIKFKK